MPSAVIRLHRKVSIWSAVQLLVVLSLCSCFGWHASVVCLPRLTTTVDNTEKAGGLPKRHQSEVVISGTNDDIRRAKQRLDDFVGVSPGTRSTHINGRKFKQLLPDDIYQRFAYRLPYSFNAFRPNYFPDDGTSLAAIKEEFLKTKTQTTIDPEEQECILGKAHHYMAHWLNRNGTINTENIGIEGCYLDLSNNVFPSIIEEFKPFLRNSLNQRLVFLSMANSGINTVPQYELTLVNSTLTYLSLMGNVLIPFGLPVLYNLQVLDLRNCGLSSLSNNAFTNTPNLVKLFLANNGLVKLRSTHFTGLSHLRHLDLSYITQSRMGGMTGYEQQVDPYNSLTEGLDLSEDVFTPLTNLTFLDISYTKLLTYSARAFRHISIEQLSLCYTSIPIIVGSMMNGSLKVLDISGNPGITTAIHNDRSDARRFNVNLEILVCENSTVKHLEWFKGMVNLKVLLLSTNNINQLTNQTFANMENLEILDLSSNHISNWHQRVFEKNEMLYILDLSDNNINVLTTEMLYDFASVNFLAIGQNSFVCHCLLREFIELAAKNSQSISCLLNSIVNQLDDSSPELMEHSHEENDTVDPNSTTLNPSTLLGFTDPAVTKADRMQKSIPQGEQLPVTEGPHSEEMQKSTGEYNVLFRVIHSYVSTIYDSTAKFQESLEKYGRSRPSFRIYHKMVDARVRAQFLPENCSTPTTQQPDTASETADDLLYPDYSDPLNGLQIQIIDFDEDRYKCIDLDNSEFYLFEQERCTFDRSLLENLVFGNSYNGTTANIIKFSLMFFGFALLAFIIYISKWEYVKYFCIIVRNATVLSLMKHKNESLLRKESLASVVSCFMYDVFVSYSEQDRQWVLDELLPNLEQTEDINVCLHERDFKVGVSILENIIYCMDKSRTLLLVMSESFLLSHWCQFEMHLAQHRLLETRREQMILVLLEDIPKTKRPKTLHYLMKTKTYIIWPRPTSVQPVKPKKGLISKFRKKPDARKEDDLQSLAEQRKLFWVRLRKAISDSVVWEPDIGGRGDAAKSRRGSTS